MCNLSLDFIIGRKGKPFFKHTLKGDSNCNAKSMHNMKPFSLLVDTPSNRRVY